MGCSYASVARFQAFFQLYLNSYCYKLRTANLSFAIRFGTASFTFVNCCCRWLSLLLAPVLEKIRPCPRRLRPAPVPRQRLRLWPSRDWRDGRVLNGSGCACGPAGIGAMDEYSKRSQTSAPVPRQRLRLWPSRDRRDGRVGVMNPCIGCNIGVLSF